MPKPVYADDATLAQEINSGYWQWSGSQGTQPRSWENDHPGTPTTITVNDSELQGDEQGLLAWVLQDWEDVANVQFTFTTGAADITYNDNPAAPDPKTGSTATAVTTQTTFYDPTTDRLSLTGATVDVSRNWADGPGAGLDSYFFQTLLHETGHALGLGHSGNYNGGTTNSYYNTDSTLFVNDTWQYSVMSYNDQSQYGGATADYVLTPQMADIYAIQADYGATANTRSGDTVYGFNSAHSAGELYNFARYTSAPAFTIYDTGGNDTLDCSGYSEDQIISLEPGTWSNVGGKVDNIGIYTGVTIENAVGGSGADELVGNDAANVLTGNAGNDDLIGHGGADTLDGGAGTDTADYNLSPAAVNVFLTAQSLNSGGDAAGDTLISIENLIGSGYGDILSGDAGDNDIKGGFGNDYLAGAGGTNTLDGGYGDDELASGSGADAMIGGAGTDTATYELASGGVTADLLKPSLNTGEAKGDTYASVENLIGSSSGDTLRGDNNANVITYGLSGASGNDRLYGRGGNDRLIGGTGKDVLDGGAGDDVLSGGRGADKFLFDTAPNASTNVDHITDFTHGSDTIELSHTNFPALAAGALPSGDFVIGSKALNASEHILYNSTTGVLLYDPDGKGGVAATRFAVLSTDPTLSSADFRIV